MTSAELKALAVELRKPSRKYYSEPDRIAALSLASVFDRGQAALDRRVNVDMLAECARQLLQSSKLIQ